jgi:hypothetical protein
MAARSSPRTDSLCRHGDGRGGFRPAFVSLRFVESITLTSIVRSLRASVALLVCGFALAVTGCGGGKPVAYTVKGRVVDGKNNPAYNALVIFHPADPGQLPAGVLPQGRVDKAGDFVLATYDKDDGAPPGKYAVTVFWQRPQTSPFDGDGPDILGGRYNNPREPKFSFTVEAKAGNVVPELQVIVGLKN